MPINDALAIIAKERERNDPFNWTVNRSDLFTHFLRPQSQSSRLKVLLVHWNSLVLWKCKSMEVREWKIHKQCVNLFVFIPPRKDGKMRCTSLEPVIHPQIRLLFFFATHGKKTFIQQLSSTEQGKRENWKLISNRPRLFEILSSLSNIPSPSIYPTDLFSLPLVR